MITSCVLSRLKHEIIFRFNCLPLKIIDHPRFLSKKTDKKRKGREATISHTCLEQQGTINLRNMLEKTLHRKYNT